ncbi:hypothetical protein B0H67DRAFT_552344 [Lasiosphaeris hirsuta]|uniref:BZIP domain-containing protein n=1 Tax=Lasiosphaeris hirsuta TaxID=260670 RepID=A0AA40AQE4_9PEZI|nr:hypothetical protein B0H67DRAFT_552344 [Lasiosphaeris hirsuta]
MSSLNSPSPMSPISMSRPVSMTTKEWVIPPRPKPGRKPATDTPPTKRKAQNRAAQRAFRERRAARVGELEEQLDEQKEDHDRAVREMQDRISHLEAETQTLQSRCQWLEALLEKERQGRNDITTSWDAAPLRNSGTVPAQIQPEAGQLKALRPVQRTERGLPTESAAALAEPRPMAQPFSISQIISPPEDVDESLDFSCGGCQDNGRCACAEEALQNSNMPIGCGKCTLGSRCECLEESIRASMAADLKRPLPPGSSSSLGPEEKRQRSDSGLALETDFTAMSTSTRRTRASAPSTTASAPLTQSQPELQSQFQPLASVEPRESCGFCKDGTYCVCADSMMTPAAPSGQQTTQPTQQTHTPPPSEDDVVPMPMEVTATGAIKLPGLHSFKHGRTAGPAKSRPLPAPPTRAAGGCGPNGPGTCAQCLSDPVSGLFCRSLAANFERNSRQQQPPVGCCGNGGPGGCCKTGKSDADLATPGRTDASASSAPSASTPGLGLSLSCADAYKTLASHRHFDEAADDIGSWLPKLRAVPIPPLRSSEGLGGEGFYGYARHSGRDHVSAGRAPIEVEAASIMSVLKGFDVRFGRGE